MSNQAAVRACVGRAGGGGVGVGAATRVLAHEGLPFPKP